MPVASRMGGTCVQAYILHTHLIRPGTLDRAKGFLHSSSGMFEHLLLDETASMRSGLQVRYRTHKYYYLTRFMFAFHLIALFFGVCALFTGLLALCSRIGSFLSSLPCSIALFFQTLTAALMTCVPFCFSPPNNPPPPSPPNKR